jgi:hypothetical protein
MPRSRPRLTGLSGLGVGLEWDWVTTDAEIIRRLLVLLEDRRVLSYPPESANVSHVVASVIRIRDELTGTLQELAAQSGAALSVRALRDACRGFLDCVDDSERLANHDDEFVAALDGLQSEFADYVRLLADRYAIHIYGSLADLLQLADEAEAEAQAHSGGLAADPPPSQ